MSFLLSSPYPPRRPVLSCSIETKYKEQKLFRLASELTGVEGKVEASSWETVGPTLC